MMHLCCVKAHAFGPVGVEDEFFLIWGKYVSDPGVGSLNPVYRQSLAIPP